MKKHLLTWVVGAAAALSAQAQTLNTGDLAFTSFNADEDGWSIVTFADIAGNTNVYFTDNEWTGAALNAGEGFQVWNSGGNTISAGSVVRFSAIQTTNRAASLGSLTTAGGSLDLNATADTVYAYLGDSAAAPTTFLAAISNGTFGNAATGSLTGTGLTVGAGAIQLTASTDYAQYTGPRDGFATFGAYKTAVTNSANWSMQVDGISQAGAVPNTTAFSVTAVPEPETYALLLAGLGLVAASARKRKKS